MRSSKRLREASHNGTASGGPACNLPLTLEADDLPSTAALTLTYVW